MLDTCKTWLDACKTCYSFCARILQASPYKVCTQFLPYAILWLENFEKHKYYAIHTNEFWLHLLSHMNLMHEIKCLLINFQKSDCEAKKTALIYSVVIAQLTWKNTSRWTGFAPFIYMPLFSSFLVQNFHYGVAQDQYILFHVCCTKRFSNTSQSISWFVSV